MISRDYTSNPFMLLFILTTLFLFCIGSAFQPAIGGRHYARTSFIEDDGQSPADDNAAPVYITIGPPCSGKTEALRAYLLSEGYNPDNVFSRDVALDDQSSVYHRIPLAAFLFPSTHLDPSIGQQLLKSGSTVKDRLFDPSYDSTDQEIRNVMLRIAGRITPHEFAERTLALAEQAGDTVKFFQKRRTAVAHDLMTAVEQVVVQAVSEVICQMQLQQRYDDEDCHDSSDELPYDDEAEDTENKLDLTSLNATQAHLLSARSLIKTPHVELFVPQAIFHGGIERAHEAFCELLQSFRKAPVSWGNTNTRPLEYAAALSAAERIGRPVKFIAWGTSRLPAVSRQELLRRNVARFRNTGRYIPAGAIGAALGRVESLIKDAKEQVEELFGDKEPHPTGVHPDQWENHKMDVAFACLAGFHMDEDGFVVQVDQTSDFRKKTVRRNTNKRLLSVSSRNLTSGKRQKR